MSREILLLVDALAREKSVEKEIVFTALEMALSSATKKDFTKMSIQGSPLIENLETMNRIVVG